MFRFFKVIKNPYKIIHVVDWIGLGKFIPDKMYLRIKHRACIGKKLNLKNPKTYNEKLQWLKLNDHNPLYIQLVDKYEVRKYIAETIGDEYLIPLVGGPWNSVDEIDFEALPEQFVLKCTHDSGGLVICRDKSKLDVEKAKRKLEKSLRHNYYYNSREWPYKNIKPRIILEKFMSDCRQYHGLIDYKFFCCNGQPQMLYVSQGLENHSTASISFLKLNWSFQPFRRSDYKSFETLPLKPKNYEKMLKLSADLADKFPFIRVDLYEINEKIYFSELTFSPCGGMIPFDPPTWDDQLGEWISLPNRQETL